MATVHGVILDVDGTLIDSNDAHAHAWVDALREFGYDNSFNQVRHLVGMGGDNLLPRAIQVKAESPHGKEIAKNMTRFLNLATSQP